MNILFRNLFIFHFNYFLKFIIIVIIYLFKYFFFVI